jgi:hypothetical protein
MDSGIFAETKPVANARLGKEMARPGGIAFDLLTQLADVDS